MQSGKNLFFFAMISMTCFISPVVAHAGERGAATATLPRQSGSSPPSAPGFDCSKASTPIEKMICADTALARLDATLLATYKEVVKAAADGVAIKKEQVNWLRQVRDQCPDLPCLSTAYQQRIAALQQRPPTSSQADSSLFPATYKGGFTGKEEITFSDDGRLIAEGVPTGSYRQDPKSPWSDAKYPLLLLRAGSDGRTEEEHCKIQPDRRKLICTGGGSLSAEYERQGTPPEVRLPVAKKCDEEQLYLDVMDAARKAKPDLELKGASDIRMHKDGHCLIVLYYLDAGRAVHQQATYGLGRPLTLTLINKP
ncbi:MAG: lysozyme inhibitor LprI family protein [Magnetococcus sp. YQC-3]